MSLTNKTIANSYKDLLQVDNSNSGVDATLRNVKDGEGTGSSLMLSDDSTKVIPSNDDTTTTFLVNTSGGTNVFKVDTTNQLVYGSGNIVNTQYTHFSVVTTHFSGALANTHYAVPYVNGNNNSTGIYIGLGTSTDPATTFTTADSSGQKASALVPVMWNVGDAISIDGVRSIEGADAATGDTTRMHLMSYDFTSGATNCLTNGTLIAHNSDVTNAGSEQPYLSSWTVDSAAVAAGKVILATYRSDSVNSDYSLQITVKYHLT